MSILDGTWRGLTTHIDVGSYVSGTLNSTFLCASYRSLYVLSGLSLVRLSDVLFLVTDLIIPTCVAFLEKSYLLQSYKTHRMENAYIFSSKLGARIILGLNLTHLPLKVCTHYVRLHISSSIHIAPPGIALILGGRMK